MGMKTVIEWCDSSVNEMMGCDGCELWNSKVKTCYSGVMTERYAGRKGWPASFDKPEIFPGRIEKACRWSDLTGTVRPDKPWLDGMPRMIFLNDMGDTFTESLPIDWLMPLIPMMARSPHIWMFLTKRPKRMLRFFEILECVPDNFWLGVTITSGTERVKDLLKIPATVRFLSVEPMLGRIDLPEGIDFVICGGESGADGRRLSPIDVRLLRDQCILSGIPYFFKQWGEWIPGSQLSEPLTDNKFNITLCVHTSQDVGMMACSSPWRIHTNGGYDFYRVGKKQAGHLLDGVAWRQMPKW